MVRGEEREYLLKKNVFGLNYKRGEERCKIPPCVVFIFLLLILGLFGGEGMSSIYITKISFKIFYLLLK